MRLIYLLKRLVFQVKVNGLKNAFKEMIYRDRKIIVIEKEIAYEENVYRDDDTDFIIIDQFNYGEMKRKFNLGNMEYFVGKNARCMVAVKYGMCAGYQWWTQDNGFRDLRKLRLNLKGNEAYLFDLFVFPEHRGGNVPKSLAVETFNHLCSCGVNKFYGFYFSDNLRALWWHRAFLKAKEINKIKMQRFLFLEIVDGRLFV